MRRSRRTLAWCLYVAALGALVGAGVGRIQARIATVEAQATRPAGRAVFDRDELGKPVECASECPAGRFTDYCLEVCQETI